MPNAWIPFQYATDENGTSSASFVIDSGFDYDQNVHHAFDVQGPDGKSIACGTLVPMGFGLAIHRGETCKTDVDIRGHFWRPMDSPDPWEDIVYIPDQHGNAIGSFAIKTGFTCSAHDQHAIVIKGEPAENDSDFDSDYDPFQDVRFQVEVEDDTDFRSDMGEGERIACGALFDIDEREDHSDDGYPYERTFLVLGSSLTHLLPVTVNRQQFQIKEKKNTGGLLLKKDAQVFFGYDTFTKTCATQQQELIVEWSISQ